MFRFDDILLNVVINIVEVLAGVILTTETGHYYWVVPVLLTLLIVPP